MANTGGFFFFYTQQFGTKKIERDGKSVYFAKKKTLSLRLEVFHCATRTGRVINGIYIPLSVFQKHIKSITV